MTNNEQQKIDMGEAPDNMRDAAKKVTEALGGIPDAGSLIKGAREMNERIDKEAAMMETQQDVTKMEEIGAGRAMRKKEKDRVDTIIETFTHTGGVKSDNKTKV